MRFKKLIAIPVAVATVAIAGAAYAAWNSGGAGSGTAQATTSAESVIASAASLADLYPGAVKDITVTVSNPNAYPVLVTSISAGSSVLVNGTCVAGTVTSDARTIDATGIFQTGGTVKTIAGNGSGTYTLVTRMTAGALDTCKLQSFPLALTATIVSNA